uniref:Uncharacterized protein n=1 Tax=Solanum lycopersicum TaxID=4081 RepID=A0A3Q7GK20_SOLLC
MFFINSLKAKLLETKLVHLKMVVYSNKYLSFSLAKRYDESKGSATSGQAKRRRKTNVFEGND